MLERNILITRESLFVVIIEGGLLGFYFIGLLESRSYTLVLIGHAHVLTKKKSIRVTN